MPAVQTNTQGKFDHLIGLRDRTGGASVPNPPHPSIDYLLSGASQGICPYLFAYLRDTYLAPNGMASIPWHCLRDAAYRGDIPLAETFFQRDPDCFNATEPPPAIGSVVRDGHQQFNIAIRNNRFEYIDFMLAHGGDINTGFDDGNDLLRMVVRCAVDDEVTMRRVRFLASRGVKVKESGALREVVEGGSVELVACLLDCGADVNRAMGPRGESPLMVAATEGYEGVVRLLLDRGAHVDAVNGHGRDAVAMAKEKGHTGVESIVRTYRLKMNATT